MENYNLTIKEAKNENLKVNGKIPKIIKVLKEMTGLNYVELYRNIKLVRIDKKEDYNCCCGVSIIHNFHISINDKSYIIGSTCIENIEEFLRNELKYNKKKYKKDETEILNKACNDINKILKKIKNSKKYIKEIKEDGKIYKLYQESYKFIFNEMEEEFNKNYNIESKKIIEHFDFNKRYEKLYDFIDDLYDEYYIEKYDYYIEEHIDVSNYYKNYNELYFTFGKYKGQHLNNINDLNYFGWLLKENKIYNEYFKNEIKKKCKLLLNK
jgi:hypothetical protein